MWRARRALDSSYLGENEFGPFFIEADYFSLSLKLSSDFDSYSSLNRAMSLEVYLGWEGWNKTFYFGLVTWCHVVPYWSFV
jgi:hypothetical protein